MDEDQEYCYRCGESAETERGVIYVRAEVDGRWLNAPICQACWDTEQPGREPFRVKFDNMRHLRLSEPDPTTENPDCRHSRVHLAIYHCTTCRAYIVTSNLDRTEQITLLKEVAERLPDECRS